MLNKKQREFDYRDVFLKTDTDEEVTARIDMKLEKYEKDSRDFRHQNLLNSAFARGNQWCTLNKRRGVLVSYDDPNQRRRVTDDLISPWKAHTIANMTTALPEFTAVPDGERNSTSVIGARVGTKLLSYYWDAWKFIELYIQMSGYCIDTGNALTFVNYVPNAKKVSTLIIDPDTNTPQRNDDGSLMYEFETVGDLTVDILMADQVVCDLSPVAIYDKTWAIIRVDRSMDYYRDNPAYNKKKDKDKKLLIDKMNPDSQNQYSWDGVEKISRGRHETITGTEQKAIEYIYLQPPNNINDEGMVCIYAGRVLLDRQKWPYAKLNRLPIEHFHYPKESGEFYARSPIEKQIPLQQALNILESIVIENAYDMCHLKWLLHAASGVDDINDTTEVIRWNGTQKPEQNDLKPLPQYIEDRIQGIKASIRDIQNFHGASMGTSVSGVRSDVHAQNLQDQDLLPQQTVDKLFESSFERLGEIILSIAADKLDDQRTMIYTDTKGREHAIENFRGSMLGDVHRVKVKMINTQMRSRNMMTRNIFDFANAGLITDDYGRPDRIKIMSMLEFALPDEIMRDYNIHSNQAYKENDKMMSGQPVMPYPFQKHDIHLSVHQEFQNSDEYMTLLDLAQTGDQEAQTALALFDQHIQQTSQLFQQSLMALQQPQEAQQQKPQPSQAPKQKKPE